MKTYTTNSYEENKDKIKSAILAILIWSAILLFVFIYKLKPTPEEKEREVVTTMLVNFGDNRNGNGLEEPANQEGSLASVATEQPIVQPEAIENNTKETNTELKPEVKKSEPQKEVVKEKVISGNNPKMKVAEKTDSKASSNTSTSKDIAKNATNSSSKNVSKSSASQANAKVGNGDGKGNAAIGNFLKGRGNKAGGQGDGTGVGNSGDPLGGDGNGDSKVGIDRRLTGYIPGTMGRGGEQPSHSCAASGSITIVYTVDKVGNVISAHRSGGISDPCVVSTSISWVKKYVKAEKASVSSTGSYKITF